MCYIIPFLGYAKRNVTKMSMGERLRDERKRLGYSQSEFAELVGASYKSQLRWEKNESSPSAEALAIWAGVGLDVLFVVTGVGGGANSVIPKMSPDRQEVLNAYDQMSPEGQRAFLDVGVALSQPKPSKEAG